MTFDRTSETHEDLAGAAGDTALGAGAAPGDRGGPGWREIDRQLRDLARRRAALDAEEARWLVAAYRAEVHVRLGLGSFVEYAERVLGYRPRTTLERLRVAEALEALPATREALAAGSICYSGVRELTRVAIPETEDAWLAAAVGKTVRDVEELVSGRAPGDLPSDPQDPALMPRHLRLELSPGVYALFLETRRRLEDTLGQRLSDDELVTALCEHTLGRRDDGVPPYQVALTVCASCDRVTQDGAGEAIDVPPHVAEAARCDAEVIGRVDGPAPDLASLTIPRPVRRQVTRRDHGRCTVPGCRSSRGVAIHHVVWQSSGGGHEPRNLTLACARHHGAIHEGRIVVTGEAPHALVWTHADGRPYGAPPPGSTHVGSGGGVPEDGCAGDGRAGGGAWVDGRDPFALARRALRTSGFPARIADAAVALARAHVGPDASVEDALRAALRACHRDSRAGP